MTEGHATAGTLELRAPAKVNLTLRILGRLPSGFHELETLFQAIDLCDDLRVWRTGDSEVSLHVVGADVGPTEDNLVYRAVQAFRRRSGVREGVGLELTKRIPAGGGLGGGSSDAGATLRALDALFPGRVSRDGLHDLAAGLGSDVPFFIGPEGLKVGRGRGELLRAIAPLPTAHLVLGLPPVHVATGPAFGALARTRAERRGPLPRPLFEERPLPTTWAEVAAVAVNDFEEPVSAAHPEVALALAALRATDPLFALLSGSGGTVFGVYPDAGAAEVARGEAARRCPSARFECVATLSTLPGLNARGPRP